MSICVCVWFHLCLDCCIFPQAHSAYKTHDRARKGTVARAHTPPQDPAAQSGQTLTEVGGHQPADLATAFLPPRPRAREWPRSPLPDSLLRTALTPLHPHRARPCCCYRHRGSRRFLPWKLPLLQIGRAHV